MAGALALRCIRAPINGASVLIGRAGAACSSAATRRVQISEDLWAVEAVAPGADPDHVILYFHGGGHWMLTPDSYRWFIGRLSAATQARVVAVDYRKPPRVRFPAGLEDALTAWRWAQAQHPGTSVAVAGDSSGGNLAFALVVKLAQLGERQPVAYLGISPWLRLDLQDYWWDYYGRFAVHLYLGGRHKVTSPDDPLLTPANSGPEIVRRFPPILMHAGKHELATPDVKEMAALCERMDMPVEVQLYSGPHIFQIMPGFPESTKDSLMRMNAFLQKHWGSKETCSGL